MRDTRDAYNSPSLAQLNTNTVDPYLSEILRRPPVGTSYSPVPAGQPAGRVQFNENVRYEEPPRLNFDQFRSIYQRNKTISNMITFLLFNRKSRTFV